MRDFDVIWIAQQLTGLVSLSIDGMHAVQLQLSDAALAVIGTQLQQLTYLGFCGDGVTDVGVQCLTHLHRLETLSLHCPHLTEEGRRQVSRLTQP